MLVSLEQKLLLQCAAFLSQGKISEPLIRLLENKPNWERVIKTARRHSVASALFCVLAEIPPNHSVPEKYLSQLKEDYLDTLCRNIIITEELKKLLLIFHQAKIDVVLCKGAALIAAVYQNPAYRFMSDIDILVHKNDLLWAQEFLLSNGYSQNASFSSRQKHANHLPPFWNSAKNIRIELHWTIGKADGIFNFNMEKIWSRMQPIKWDNLSCLILSPEDMVLHLCFHLFVSYVDILIFRTLFDIAAIVTKFQETINWDHIVADGIKYNIATPVYTVLLMSRELLSLDIPLPVLTQLRSNFSLTQFTFLNTPYQKFGAQPVFRKIYLTSDFKNIVRYLFSTLFPSADFLSHKYSLPKNSKSIYFYYFIRPLHLFSNYCISVFKTTVKYTLVFFQNLITPNIEKSVYSIFKQ